MTETPLRSRVAPLAGWINTIGYGSARLVALARKLEGLGYGALWINDGFGSDPMALAAHLLDNTERLTIATGVANIYGRDPMAMAGARYALNEMSGGRFLLGIGVSHAPIVEGMRGHAYGKPLAAMRDYLAAMARIESPGPALAERPLTVIAALGPKMLEMATELADGAHPFATTPKHTALARSILGPDKLLLVEQKVMLETDAAKARVHGRFLASGLAGLPNYRNSFLRMGFTDADFADGGSDRLADALLAWGDEAAIRARVQAHFDAGADQVCLQVMPRDGAQLTEQDEALFEALAPGQ